MTLLLLSLFSCFCFLFFFCLCKERSIKDESRAKRKKREKVEKVERERINRNQRDEEKREIQKKSRTSFLFLPFFLKSKRKGRGKRAKKNDRLNCSFSSRQQEKGIAMKLSKETDGLRSRLRRAEEELRKRDAALSELSRRLFDEEKRAEEREGELSFLKKELSKERSHKQQLLTRARLSHLR